MTRPRCPGALRRLRNDQSGSATIEAVLWFPMFMFILILIADASMIFYGQAQALRIVQDGNRAFSVGRLSDEAAAQDYIRNTLVPLSPHAEVSTVLSGGIITSTARIPVDDLVAVGSIPALGGFRLTVQSQHFLEY